MDGTSRGVEHLTSIVLQQLENVFFSEVMYYGAVTDVIVSYRKEVKKTDIKQHIRVATAIDNAAAAMDADGLVFVLGPLYRNEYTYLHQVLQKIQAAEIIGTACKSVPSSGC